MKDLSVVILTHNRGEMLCETIISVLNQTCHDFKFIVSDNSNNDETEMILKKRNLMGKFEYRKRNCEYSSFEHFNKCISEIDTKYFVLFHDDDIMLPMYIETMYNTINGSNYVAVGCNARFLINNKARKRMLKEYTDIVIKNPKDLVEQYCKLSIVPFPSYIYSKELIESNRFINKIGKYSDVYWLMSINSNYKIFWLKKSMLLYRLHNNQDSAKVDYRNQWKLDSIYKQYVKSNTIKEYKIHRLYIYSTITKKRFNYRLFLIFIQSNLILGIKYLIKKCLVF